MPIPSDHSRLVYRTVAAFAAVYLIWGSTYLAIRVAIDTIPPLLMIGSRFAVAGLVLLGWLRLRGEALPPVRQRWAAAGIGCMLLGLGTGSVAWAQQYVTSGMAALLVTTVPLFMVALDWLWKRSVRPTWRTVLGLALGGLGIVLLVGPRTLSDANHPLVPMLVILMGAFSWSVGSVHARTADLPKNVFMSTALQMAGGGGGLVLVGLLLGEGRALDLAAVTQASFLGWAYLVVFGSFIGFGAYVWLLQNVTPAKVATYAYVNPVVAVVLGWALLDEAVSGLMLVAIVVLVLAVVLITLPGATAKRSIAEAPPDDARSVSASLSSDAIPARAESRYEPPASPKPASTERCASMLRVAPAVAD
ncbi:MAG: EamA family transporter [Bacteroidota bacterium]